jgi:prolyl-tRNA editing enzyme YbaK/EbsC (Cys-tRNA(Pro) deacylase)
MLTDLELSQFIASRGIEAKLVYPGVPTPTVPDAARALNVLSQQIVKSLIFIVQEPLLVMAAGEARISYRALANFLGTSRKQVRMASPEEALELSGFEVGAMPPFGHRQSLPTLMDQTSLEGQDLVYAGGGSKSALLEVGLQTILEVTGGQWVKLTEIKETI